MVSAKLQWHSDQACLCQCDNAGALPALLHTLRSWDSCSVKAKPLPCCADARLCQAQSWGSRPCRAALAVGRAGAGVCQTAAALNTAQQISPVKPQHLRPQSRQADAPCSAPDSRARPGSGKAGTLLRAPVRGAAAGRAGHSHGRPARLAVQQHAGQPVPPLPAV